jgi:hypothetical protein
MEIVYIVIWLLLGIIAVWREYHGTLKSWYDDFNESYWDFHKREGSSAIKMLLIFSPVLIFGGLISLIMFESLTTTCWWFTTKNK